MSDQLGQVDLASSYEADGHCIVTRLLEERECYEHACGKAIKPYEENNIHRIGKILCTIAPY
jgi:hypothetical protein